MLRCVSLSCFVLFSELLSCEVADREHSDLFVVPVFFDACRCWSLGLESNLLFSHDLLLISSAASLKGITPGSLVSDPLSLNYAMWYFMSSS